MELMETENRMFLIRRVHVGFRKDILTCHLSFLIDDVHSFFMNTFLVNHV